MRKDADNDGGVVLNPKTCGRHLYMVTNNVNKELFTISRNDKNMKVPYDTPYNTLIISNVIICYNPPGNPLFSGLTLQLLQSNFPC